MFEIFGYKNAKVAFYSIRNSTQEDFTFQTCFSARLTKQENITNNHERAHRLLLFQHLVKQLHGVKGLHAGAVLDLLAA